MDNREWQFKDRFIAAFLAGMAANQFEQACQDGWSAGAYKRMFPIEDAEALADEAWRRYRDEGPQPNHLLSSWLTPEQSVNG